MAGVSVGGPYPNTILPCKDGEIRMQAMTKREWNRILEMMGDPDWGRDPRFQDRLKMNEMYADELDGHIGAWLKERTKQELSQLFYEYGVPFTPVNTIADFVDDPHLAARGFFVEVRAPTGRSAEIPREALPVFRDPLGGPPSCATPRRAQTRMSTVGCWDTITGQLVRLRQSAVI